MKEPVLEIKNLTVSYLGTIKALSEVSISVQEKNIVALIGTNGAGKSTLLLATCGLIPFMNGRIVSGTIDYRGKDICNWNSNRIIREGISLVPEGRRIFKELSVEENLLIGAYTHYRKRSNALKTAYEYFPVLLEKRRKIPAGYLSGGEQQMLAIARSLMCHPKMLLLDEVSLGLAPLIVEHIYSIIQKLKKTEGLSMLIVDQNVPNALAACDYAYIFEIGRIAMGGMPEEIRSREDIWEFYLR